MKKGVLVVIGFCLVTVVLTWFWGEWGRLAYGKLLKQVAPPIYELIGFGDARVGAFRQRYINFVPFVGLMIVTAGITMGRRLIGLAAGLFALFVSHLALNLTEMISPQRQLPFVPSLVSDALPFLVWVVVAYPALVQLLPGVDPSAAEASAVEGSPEDDTAQTPP
ncbi:MAG: hypothetical protein CL908_24010 [Deltaproteobacteria bacterium]|nr:hypothetical protein [Deltaproteobacteria bacterium]